MKHFFHQHIHALRLGIFATTAGFSLVLTIYHFQTVSRLQKQTIQIRAQDNNLNSDLQGTEMKLEQALKQLSDLQNQDQVKINRDLSAEIKQIQTTYKQAVADYQDLLDLKNISKKTDKFDAAFAKSLTLLADRNYASASALLTQLKQDIDSEQAKLGASFSIPANVASSNSAPGSGFSRQKVDSDVGSFLVDIIAADMGSTRVIVDTASDSDCHDNCPVLALADYAGRSGAFAGINGPYFCPASYPSCAGKGNSFDTLLMNKNKTYFNSDNNVYSSVPAVIFSSGGARFVGASSEWGRDTGVDSVIAAQPMLLSGGNITFGGDSEAKRGSRGSRSFIGTKGNTVYIGTVQSATVVEVAHVLKALSLEYALNLDSGGSTALWSGGKYLAGPGRATPFGILFVRR